MNKLKKSARIGIVCFIVVCLFAKSFVFAESEQPNYGKVYCRNSSHAKQIALTFDDGPHPRYTKEILKILEEYHIPATFFIIGVNAENYPQTLQQILNSGCEIGNHTFSHCRIGQMNPQELRSQILQCEEAIFHLTGIRPKLFRPPEGAMNDTVRSVVGTLNYNIALWSIDTLDWAMNPAENITTTVLNNLKGGDIILMHDYVSGGNTTCNALRQMIPQILAKGYQFVTVSELIDGDHAVSRVPVKILNSIYSSYSSKSVDSS